MYEAHWNLSEKPFENDQNLKYFYESKNHKEALVRILYATEQAKPLAVIMGEHGSGKTYVCRSAAGELKKRGYRAGLLNAPSADPAELYRRASESLGLMQNERPIESRFDFVRACRPTDPADTKRTVLFVDAIDSVNDERIFGEIRTLLDVTLEDGKPMFTVVLSGTPRSRDTLRRHPSLVQRIEVGYDLAPLGEEDARNYVLHRLRIAAGPKRIFDNAALRGAYKASSGLPRLLNRVCDLALLIGKIEAKDQILRETVDQAADEVRELGVLGAGRPPVGAPREGGEGGRPDGRRPDRRDERGRDRGRGERHERRGEPAAPAGAPVAAAAPSEGGDDEAEDSYVFNPDEHKDIESMSEIIQGSLKVVSGGPQRRRRGTGKRKERGEYLDYFGAATSEEGHVEEEDEEAEGAPEAASDEQKPIPEHHEHREQPVAEAEREPDDESDDEGGDESGVPEVIRTYSPSDERGGGDRGPRGGDDDRRRRGRRGRRGRGRGRDDRRDDRPRDDRPRDDRPRDDRPRDDRPRDDRPRDERPRDERGRSDRFRDDRPRGDRPRDDRPREDRPRDDRPREDRPREDRPREDRPREEPRPVVTEARAPEAPRPAPAAAPAPMDLGDFASGLLSSDQVAQADEQRRRDAERASRAREEATRRAEERQKSEERRAARERESESDTGFAAGILDAPPPSS